MYDEEIYIEEEEQDIDLMEYVRKLRPYRKTLLKAALWGAVIGVVMAFGTSKSYTVNMSLAPERTSKSTSSSLTSIASMLGAGNLTSLMNGNELDALNVMFYPEVLASTPFIIELLECQVTTIDDEEESMTLMEFLDNQKGSWIRMVLGLPGKAIGGIKSLFSEEEEEEGEAELNSFRLTKAQESKVKALRNAIASEVDNKTGLTTISVTLNDPMVTAIIADSVLSKLQKYITTYRVSKAQQNCDYLENLYKERQTEYYKAQQDYANYVDANKNVILQTALTERERLQNDMTLAYQIYTQVAAQLQAARAKLQEDKPVFAVVEPATVPLEPSGRSRKLTVLIFIFLAVAGTAAWILFGRDFYVKFRNGLTADIPATEKD